MIKRLFTIVAFFALSIMGVQAQQNPMLTPMPQDPELRKGVLPNGLTYYIKHNDKPENQADFYIYDKVGAAQEEDLQIGLAHFLEHMAFNGTENFPDKNMINYLESIGVKFGANLNAWTAMEQTQYMMQGVPLTDPSVVDNVLMILHDWAYYISLEEEEIDNERGVIIEELRTRNDASWRIREKNAPYLYGDTRYAKRNIIGTEERLKSFTYDELRDFYHRWYNTANQCIVVVGDFDVDEMEQKVIATMSSIPAVENPEAIPYMPIPANEKPAIGIFTDPELTESSVEIIARREAWPTEMNNLLAYELYSIIDSFIATIVNERLNDMAQKPGAPFIGAGFYGGNITASMDLIEIYAQPREGELLKAFEAIYSEFEKVRRFGFTPSEFERAQTNIMRRNQQAYDRRNDRRNGEFVGRYTSNFRRGTPIYSAEQEWEIDSMLISMIDLNTVNAVAQQERFLPTNQVVLMSQPEKEGLAVPTVEEVENIMVAVNNAELKPYEDEGVKKPLIPATAKLKGSKVVAKKTTTDAYGNTIWTLKNGVKVVLKPTDFKADEVIMRATMGGGMSLVADEDMAMANQLTTFISYQGVGEFSMTDLQKQLAGKAVNVGPALAHSSNGWSASCSPKDLETMFQLVYLYTVAPRFDEDAFNLVKEQLVDAYANIESDPNYALQRELFANIYDKPERMKALGAEDMKALTFEQYKRVYGTIYSNPDDLTFFIVGNFSEAEIQPLVEKYLGSLPATKGTVTYNTANAIGYQKGDRTHRFNTAMEMPKTAIFYALSGEMEVNLKNSLTLSIFDQLLDIRYTKSIREEMGATYGVSSSGQLSSLPSEPDYVLFISFDTKPEIADEARGALLTEIEKIAAEGATDEELGKIKEYMLKERADALKQNGRWLNWMISSTMYGVDYTTGYEDIVAAISSEDIKALASKMLADGNILRVIMDPQ
ncbi:MAG: insulinase family protein [Tidjanibacter sp.]|nr:insulinase family protein [Tidjanibacter sp.]